VGVVEIPENNRNDHCITEDDIIIAFISFLFLAEIGTAVAGDAVAVVALLTYKDQTVTASRMAGLSNRTDWLCLTLGVAAIEWQGIAIVAGLRSLLVPITADRGSTDARRSLAFIANLYFTGAGTAVAILQVLVVAHFGEEVLAIPATGHAMARPPRGIAGVPLCDNRAVSVAAVAVVGVVIITSLLFRELTIAANASCICIRIRVRIGVGVCICVRIRICIRVGIRIRIRIRVGIRVCVGIRIRIRVCICVRVGISVCI
jgi:hypothetical protein